MSEFPIKILELASEMWPGKPALITVQVDNINDWIELKTLILTSDRKDLPAFLIYGDTVTIALTPIAMLLLQTAPNKSKFIDDLFSVVLSIKDKL